MNSRNHRLEAFFFTNKGGVRSNNEDSLVVQETLISNLSMEIPESHRVTSSSGLFSVADGIGGSQKGEVASFLVLSYLKNHFMEISDEESFTRVIYDSKELLEAYVKKSPESFNLGCTLAGVIVREEEILIFNIGDCRVYRINGRFFERITKDHSVVQHLLDEGSITEEEMRHHPRKNIVTSSISGDGIPDSVHVRFKSITFRDLDEFFICSDGIWECFSQDEMEMIYEKYQGYQFMEKLLIASLARQSSDNVTAILVKVQSQMAV